MPDFCRHSDEDKVTRQMEKAARGMARAELPLESSTSGNKPADDDVFFEAAQIILFAGDRRFNQNLCRLLE